MDEMKVEVILFADDRMAEAEEEAVLDNLLALSDAMGTQYS